MYSRTAAETKSDLGITTLETTVNNKEDKSNKVTSISSTSTDTQYPSAKCVYDALDDKMDKVNPTGSGYLSINRKEGTTIGTNSVAVGKNCEASGNNSFAEGAGNIASGNTSHAEGSSTKATAIAAHAEGGTTVASGMGSHAEGVTTTASGEYSHSEGRGTIAAGLGQHVQGQYNVEDADSKYVDIVGGGSSSSSRRNISALTTDGDLRLAGNVYVGCNGNSTGGTKLGTIDTILQDNYIIIDCGSSTVNV